MSDRYNSTARRRSPALRASVAASNMTAAGGPSPRACRDRDRGPPARDEEVDASPAAIARSPARDAAPLGTAGSAAAEALPPVDALVCAGLPAVGLVREGLPAVGSACDGSPAVGSTCEELPAVALACDGTPKRGGSACDGSVCDAASPNSAILPAADGFVEGRRFGVRRDSPERLDAPCRRARPLRGSFRLGRADVDSRGLPVDFCRRRGL